MRKMYDFHIHSIFSDGELLPAEIARRYKVLDYEAIAITDHADNTNLDFILSSIVPALDELSRAFGMKIIPGIEFTHIPPAMLDGLVSRAHELGAKIIIVHGETPAEPVAEGTNAQAVANPDVDILSHPGQITLEEAETARDNNVYLELSYRAGHNAANKHVASIAVEAGANMVINSDAHAPDDIMTKDDIMRVARESGLSRKNTEMVVSVNPKTILRSI